MALFCAHAVLVLGPSCRPDNQTPTWLPGRRYEHDKAKRANSEYESRLRRLSQSTGEEFVPFES